MHLVVIRSAATSDHLVSEWYLAFVFINNIKFNGYVVIAEIVFLINMYIALGY